MTAVRFYRVYDFLRQRIRAREVSRGYGSARRVPLVQANRVAVVLHLYYPELWPYLKKYLDKLDCGYDLYVTVPHDKEAEIPETLLELESTTIFKVPNHGRDVYPFLFVISKIKDLSYDAILKIHSKKSPHFEEGSVWLDDMIKSLTTIPTGKVTKYLAGEPTLVGPSGYYTSLAVNFEANGRRLDRILLRAGIGREKLREVTQTHRDKHGFFAGTMFWISQASLNSKAFLWSAKDFDYEKGQIDGTMAHAMERAFSLMPQAAGIAIYETDGATVRRIRYDSGVIPRWSDLYTE